jgi:nicotinamide-nucleotide amidase
MPGVPSELSLMLDEQVLPRLAARLEDDESEAGRIEAGGEDERDATHMRRPRGVTRVRARLLRTFGMGESTLESELRDIARDGDVELAFRTAFPDNFLRVFARGHSIAEADAKIERVVAAIRERLGPLVYGEGDEGLEQVAARLLMESGRTIATAESCTGGGIAVRLTDVPGSSAYFLGGVVAYSNAAKVAQLGVPEALIAEHGAVSEPVARAMAEGARARFGADLGIATTGISGPDGGSEQKPVGLVHVALASAAGTHADHFVFAVDRARHRTLTAQVGLDWVRRSLLGFELTGPSLLRAKGGGSAPSGSTSAQR